MHLGFISFFGGSGMSLDESKNGWLVGQQM
jgi:hypothetical protein